MQHVPQSITVIVRWYQQITLYSKAMTMATAPTRPLTPMVAAPPSNCTGADVLGVAGTLDWTTGGGTTGEEPAGGATRELAGGGTTGEEPAGGATGDSAGGGTTEELRTGMRVVGGWGTTVRVTMGSGTAPEEAGGGGTGLLLGWGSGLLVGSGSSVTGQTVVVMATTVVTVRVVFW